MQRKRPLGPDTRKAGRRGARPPPSEPVHDDAGFACGGLELTYFWGHGLTCNKQYRFVAPIEFGQVCMCNAKLAASLDVGPC